MDTWPLPLEIKSAVEMELVFRSVNLSNREDMIIWCGATSGEYSAKLGYRIQVAQCEEKYWLTTLCWKREVLPKAGAFLWVASYQRCLTRERLKRLGIAGPSRCPLCESNEESVDHLFLNCRMEAACWDWLQDKFQFQGPRQVKLEEFLCSWPIANKGGYWKGLWILAPAIVVWHIWKERNGRIFYDKAMG